MRTPELDARVLEWISNGGTLRSFCRLPGMPSHVTVHEWRKADKAFGDAYLEAKRIGYELLGEEMLDIANTPEAGEVITEESVMLDLPDSDVKLPATKRTVRTEDMLGHRKLQIETRGKLLKVWFPEEWADKVNVDHKSGGKSFDVLLRKALGLPEDDEATEAKPQ